MLLNQFTNTTKFHLLYYLLGNLPKFRLVNHEIYLNFKSTKFNRNWDLGYFWATSTLRFWCRILDNASRQAWSLSFCHNRLGSQSPHALLDQIQDTERMPVPIGVSFFKRFCCLALPGAPNCEPCFGVAVWPRFVCPLNVLS